MFSRSTSVDRRRQFLAINKISEARLEEAFALPQAAKWTVNHALKKANVKRNRYLNVFPWDQTRVTLPVIPGGNDYINASHVRMGSSCYIAAQGPLDHTQHHLWAMAFNEAERDNTDLVVIAMVTPLVELGMVKCSRYWPTKEEGTIEWSDLIVEDNIDVPGQTLSVTYAGEHKHKDDFLVTDFDLICGDKKKRVKHYHYYKWADSRTPSSIEPLLALSREIRSQLAHAPNTRPIVHCSAGVGRTGTWIAVDHYLYDKPAGNDPMYDIVVQLREHRMMMVQTVHQYAFLCDNLARISATSQPPLASQPTAG